MDVIYQDCMPDRIYLPSNIISMFTLFAYFSPGSLSSYRFAFIQRGITVNGVGGELDSTTIRPCCNVCMNYKAPML